MTCWTVKRLILFVWHLTHFEVEKYALLSSKILYYWSRKYSSNRIHKKSSLFFTGMGIGENFNSWWWTKKVFEISEDKILPDIRISTTKMSTQSFYPRCWYEKKDHRTATWASANQPNWKLEIRQLNTLLVGNSVTHSFRNFATS